jgi:hypothetical protein
MLQWANSAFRIEQAAISNDNESILDLYRWMPKRCGLIDCRHVSSAFIEFCTIVGDMGIRCFVRPGQLEMK